MRVGNISIIFKIKVTEVRGSYKYKYSIVESFRYLNFQAQTWPAVQEVAHKKRILLENVNVVPLSQPYCPIAE